MHRVAPRVRALEHVHRICRQGAEQGHEPVTFCHVRHSSAVRLNTSVPRKPASMAQLDCEPVTRKEQVPAPGALPGMVRLVQEQRAEPPDQLWEISTGSERLILDWCCR